MKKEEEGPEKGFKVSEEQAEKEIKGWLDFKKVSDRRRVILGASILALKMAIMEGDIVINGDSFEIEQTLKFPIGLDKTIKVLKYKPRILVDDIEKRTQSNPDTQSKGHILGVVAALTDQNSGMLGKSDPEDYTVMSHVAVFFVV
jgi:hypothetical protein